MTLLTGSTRTGGNRPTTTTQIPTPVPVDQPPTLRLGALLVVLCGAFLSITDFFIVNVALADIGRDLHASTAKLELVVAGYGAAYAALLVVGGRLGDAYGRRRMFLTGMVAFTLTSLLCGIAPSAGALVGARVLQGAAAALMVPQVLATIQATTTGTARTRAISVFGATGGLAAVSGQLLGGLLVSADIAGLGWRPIFLVNVPVGLVALALTPRLVPDSRSERPASVDIPGTVLLAAALVCLLLPLSEGRALGWPAWSLVMLAAVPALAVAFVLVERAGERAGRVPLVPPSLVKVRSMSRGLTMGVPFFVGFGGFMFAYAVATQGVLGWSALRSGAALAPMGIGFLASSLLSSRLLIRWGRSVLTFGLVVQALGYIGLLAVTSQHWGPHLTPAQLAPAMLVAGVGQGLVMSPLFGVVLTDVPQHAAGVGSGVMSTTQQTALAIGATAVGTLFTSLLSAWSPAHAFAVVLLVQLGVATGSTVLTHRLPHPMGYRAAAAPLVTTAEELA